MMNDTVKQTPAERPFQFTGRIRSFYFRNRRRKAMKMLRNVLGLLLLASTFASAQDTLASLELVLRFDPVPGQAISGNLAPYKGGPFYLVIKQGEVFLAANETPKIETEKEKGTVQFIHRNGLDPATRKFPPGIYELRFRSVNPGWAADKFITEITVPYSFEQHGGKPVVVFSDKGKEVQLWQKASEGSVSFIGDPMDVRCERNLTCKQISSNINFVPR
jgi:hypothetical protein